MWFWLLKLFPITHIFLHPALDVQAVQAEADTFAQRLGVDATEKLWGPPAPPPAVVTGMICSRDHPRLPGRIVQRLSPNSLSGHAISTVTSWPSCMTISTVVPSIAAPFVRKLPWPRWPCEMSRVCTKNDCLPSSLGLGLSYAGESMGFLCSP